jgi:outer membrane lipoprotein-sorting protein
MKRILQACAAFVLTLTAASAIAAPANANAHACQALAKRLSQKSAEFVQVNADGKAPAQTPNVHLANFYDGVSKKDAALRDVANAVWTLRTDMASRNCGQADAFAY